MSKAYCKVQAWCQALDSLQCCNSITVSSVQSHKLLVKLVLPVCICLPCVLQIEIEGQGYVVTRLELTFKVSVALCRYCASCYVQKTLHASG
jgi:hypothetical protein